MFIKIHSVSEDMQGHKKLAVPEKLLNQLNEATNNCFLLFTLDEQGNLQVAAQADNRAYWVTVVQDAATWLNVINDHAQDGVVESLLGDNNNEETGPQE